MALSGQDRMEILQLLSEGKITPEEAGRLLSKNKTDDADSGTQDQDLSGDETSSGESVEKVVDKVAKMSGNGGEKPKWFHIRVSNLKSGKDKVTVNIPMNIVRAGLNFGSRYSGDLAGFEWDELSTVIAGEKGILIDVEDEEDGEHVQIYVD